MADLKKWDVIVTRDTTESCVISIEAVDANQAGAMALGQSYTGGFKWEQDDTPNASKNPYVTDCQEVTDGS